MPATFAVTTTLDVVDPADGKRSLREAVNAANASAGADVIVVPAGVYKIALAGSGENGNATGDFDITSAVTIRGAGAVLTIIDGQQIDRVFDVNGTAPSSIRVVLQGVAVRNGKVTGHGGGVLVGNADLVVRDSAMIGNWASQTGGGVSNEASAGTGDTRVVRTTVARNVAGTNGGGLNVSGSSLLTVTDSTVRRNVASDFGGGVFTAEATMTSSTISGNTTGKQGGGVFATTANLTNSAISGNSAGSGGGIVATTANLTNSTLKGNSASTVDGAGGLLAITATLTNCTVSGNASAAAGGGIGAITATLTNCTISGNSAGTFGGGIAAGTATLTNCTVSGNSAGTDGGGVYTDAVTKLLNCTIVENIAQTGGGVFHFGSGTFNIKNTIIALNLVEFAGTGPDVSGAFVSQGHNLIGDGSGGTGFNNGVNGDIVGTDANPIDPKLGPLANNGGRTKTHALKAGSRAVDAGDNANVPATDQRGPGFPRKKDGNGDGVAIVDIGAFER